MNLILVLFVVAFFGHSISDHFQGVLDLVHDYSFSLSINDQGTCTILEHPHRIQRCHVGLFILFGNNPGLDTIEDHVINGHSISQMDWFLNTQDTKDLKLYGCQVIKHVIKLEILFRILNTFIDCDNQLICFFDCELPLCVHDREYA